MVSLLYGSTLPPLEQRYLATKPYFYILLLFYISALWFSTKPRGTVPIICSLPKAEQELGSMTEWRRGWLQWAKCSCHVFLLKNLISTHTPGNTNREDEYYYVDWVHADVQVLASPLLQTRWMMSSICSGSTGPVDHRWLCGWNESGGISWILEVIETCRMMKSQCWKKEVGLSITAMYLSLLHISARPIKNLKIPFTPRWKIAIVNCLKQMTYGVCKQWLFNQYDAPLNVLV
jgi:hypothetical protein